MAPERIATMCLHAAAAKGAEWVVWAKWVAWVWWMVGWAAGGGGNTIMTSLASIP